MVGLVALVAAMTPLARAATSTQGDQTPPSAPGPIVVKGVTQTSVTVAWLHATDEVGVVAYGVLWNSRRSRDMERTTLPTFTKTGLSCGTSYQVSVIAFDAAGNHSRDATEAVVATGACLDTSPPSAPSGLTQIDRTSTSATLAWKPSSDDVGVAGYVVSKSGVPQGTTSGTSYTVSGLTCGSGYTVAIQAYDAAGNRSTPVSYTGATASCADTTPPTTPTNLLQVSRTQTSMSISWQGSSDASGIVGYGVHVDGTKVATSSATSATVSALACGKGYTIAVDAVDGAGNHSAKISSAMPTANCPPSGGGGDTTPPTSPTSLRITGLSLGSASLAWNASTDNVAIAGYSVYKGSSWVGDTPGTSFLVPSLACGTTVLLGVEARDAARNRSARATVSVGTHPCGDTKPPTTPGVVTLQNRTETSLTAYWSPSTDASGVTGYGTYRDGVLVATVPSTQYTFTGLKCSSVYTLGVDAVDPSGNRSTESTTLLATAPCSDVVAPTAPTGLTVSNVGQTTLDLSWLASKDNVGVAMYDVFVGNVLTLTTKELKTAVGGLKCGVPVVLGVEASDASGNSSARSTIGATTLPCTTQVSGSLYVAPNGSDSVSCTSAQPCATFTRAYKVAKPGQVIEVASGTYPYQRIERDEAKSSSDRVVFQPVAGATVNVTQLDFGQPQFGIDTPRHVEVNGMTIGYTRVWPKGEDIVLRNLRGTWFDVLGGTGISVIGGVYGPCQAPAQGSCTPRLVGANQTVDGVAIFGMTSTDLTNYHVDGMFVRGCQSCQVTRSKFSGNMIANMRLQNCCTLAPNQDVTIENNWFAAPLQGDGVTSRTTAIDIDNAIPNLLIRNNSFAQNAGTTFADVSYAGTNTRVVNNLMQNNGCVSGVTYGSNLFIPFSSGRGNTPCSSTDSQVQSFGYVGGDDFHIISSSPAMGAADSQNCPSVDYDGQARGAACEVGSDER